MKYDYRCLNKKCQKEFEIEVSQFLKRKVNLICPHCKSRKVQKIIKTAPKVTFVGSGFYSNDKGKS